MSLDAAPVLPGETLAGKYRVERILGRGGMGIVVAARHLELDERVAIKFLLRKNDETAVARFQREARAAAKVKSEHVCRVYDVARLETGEPYLVMEYLDGIDLADRLRTEHKLPVAKVAAWMIEACSALAEAHAMGIVHRDLKPANIFLARRLDDTFTVKVLDFGISKMTSVDGMTSTTAVMGTPLYMSPEQVASAKEVDQRTDVWSLGVIMYELASGKPPFSADSIIQLSVKIREQELPPLDTGDAAFDAIVTKCLAKDPNARWPSVGELAKALAPIAGPSSVELATRAARTSATAKSALAETVRDEDEQKEEASAPVEQATLEPLSTAAKADDPPRAATPWGRVALLGAVGVATVRLVMRLSGTHDQPPPSTPSAAVADVAAPPPPIASSSAIPEIAPSAPPSAEPSKTAAVKPRPVVATAVSAATAPTASAAVTASAEPVAPAPTTSAKKKRELDRDDPYAH